jgi:hypothetical protein
MRFVNAIRLLAIMGALLGTVVLPGTASAQVAVEFSVGFAPPPLPVYDQPVCPGERYIWTPGYWAWDDDDQDYYWVPGTWVEAPEVGYLWTPGYWGWGGQAYVFHVGYWGPVVGFYGGIDYGWGYPGRGYYGGRWDHDHFYYNREVNRIDERVVRNVYNERVENNVNITRVSYNGPNGGVNVRPSPQEQAAARERHIGPVSAQNQHTQAARSNRELHASENRGKPPIAATARPAAFNGSGVVAARAGGNYNPPPNRGGNRGGATATNRPANENRAVNETRPSHNGAENTNPNRPPNATNRAETNTRPTYNHSNEVPRHAVPQSEPNANQKYQQQQEKLAQKQNQEHQKLQQQQEREHQQAQQQSANAARQQQMEQRHQQQTQQMEQRHEHQTQKMQQSQQPRQQAPPPRQNEEKKPH